MKKKTVKNSKKSKLAAKKQKTSKSASTKKKSAKRSKNVTAKSKKRKPSSSLNTRSLSQPRIISNNMGDELLKVTNVMSPEQIKAPKKVAFMVTFYVVISFSLFIFLLIKFAKPKNNSSVNMMIESSEIIENTSVESSETRDFVIATTESIDLNIDGIDNEEIKKEITKETTKETVKEATSETVKETIKDNSKITTKDIKGETSNKKIDSPSVEYLPIKNSPTPRPYKLNRNSINGLLGAFDKVLYSPADFIQFDAKELSIIYDALTEKVNLIQDKVFGVPTDVNVKGKNGLLFLNWDKVKSKILNPDPEQKAKYVVLPYAPYYEYVTSDEVGYSESTRKNNLSATFEFNKAVDKDAYYEIPVTFIDKQKNKKTGNARVLKTAKVGFSETFELLAMLELLDIEFNTKHNPYFDIKDVVGANPNAVNLMDDTSFNISDTIKKSNFNYVIFDKKGYITSLFSINKSS